MIKPYQFFKKDPNNEPNESNWVMFAEIFPFTEGETFFANDAARLLQSSELLHLAELSDGDEIRVVGKSAVTEETMIFDMVFKARFHIEFARLA